MNTHWVEELCAEIGGTICKINVVMETWRMSQLIKSEDVNSKTISQSYDYYAMTLAKVKPCSLSVCHIGRVTVALPTASLKYY